MQSILVLFRNTLSAAVIFGILPLICWLILARSGKGVLGFWECLLILIGVNIIYALSAVSVRFHLKQSGNRKSGRLDYILHRTLLYVLSILIYGFSQGSIVPSTEPIVFIATLLIGILLFFLSFLYYMIKGYNDQSTELTEDDLEENGYVVVSDHFFLLAIYYALPLLGIAIMLYFSFVPFQGNWKHLYAVLIFTFFGFPYIVPSIEKSRSLKNFPAMLTITLIGWGLIIASFFVPSPCREFPYGLSEYNFKDPEKVRNICD